MTGMTGDELTPSYTPQGRLIGVYGALWSTYLALSLRGAEGDGHRGVVVGCAVRDTRGRGSHLADDLRTSDGLDTP
jgi:hypothetical protein